MDKMDSDDARWFAWGGALLCALAVLFTWRQLAIDSEWLLAVGAFAATAIGVARRPDLGMQLLCGVAAVAGGWFAGGAYFGVVEAAAFHPLPLLAALGLALGGAVAVALTRLRDADEKRAVRLVLMLVGIGLVASSAVYYQLFTVGIAEHQVARRLLLTVVWLAAGLALVVRRRPALQPGGRVLVAAAYLKALVYDTTHLDGGLRILALLVTGGLLLGGAWTLGRRRVVA